MQAIPRFLYLSLNFLFRAESANPAPTRRTTRSRICSVLCRADFIQLTKGQVIGFVSYRPSRR